jgi:hypothetical protein
MLFKIKFESVNELLTLIINYLQYLLTKQSYYDTLFCKRKHLHGGWQQWTRASLWHLDALRRQLHGNKDCHVMSADAICVSLRYSYCKLPVSGCRTYAVETTCFRSLKAFAVFKKKEQKGHIRRLYRTQTRCLDFKYFNYSKRKTDGKISARQGRGVHVTGVSAAYTFKLNKNILSE